MLACQHGGQTRATELLSASSRTARPVAFTLDTFGDRLLMKRKILVVDIGGTHVKLLMSLRNERAFPSGPQMGPEKFIERLAETARGWKFDRVSIGFPA